MVSRESGNVDEDPHGEFGGRNILYQAMTIPDVAARYGWSAEDVVKSLAHSSEVLLKVRAAKGPSAPRRQGAGQLERDDDFGVRQGRADPGRCLHMRRRARGTRFSAAALVG